MKTSSPSSTQVMHSRVTRSLPCAAQVQHAARARTPLRCVNVTSVVSDECSASGAGGGRGAWRTRRGGRRRGGVRGCNSPRIRRQRREGVTRGGARYSRGLSTVAVNASTREEVVGKTATVGGTGIDNNGNGRWRSSGRRKAGRRHRAARRRRSTTTGSRDMRPCCVGGGHVRAPIHVPWCVSTRVAHISLLLLRALRLF